MIGPVINLFSNCYDAIPSVRNIKITRTYHFLQQKVLTSVQCRIIKLYEDQIQKLATYLVCLSNFILLYINGYAKD